MVNHGQGSLEALGLARPAVLENCRKQSSHSVLTDASDRQGSVHKSDDA